MFLNWQLCQPCVPQPVGGSGFERSYGPAKAHDHVQQVSRTSSRQSWRLLLIEDRHHRDSTINTTTLEAIRDILTRSHRLTSHYSIFSTPIELGILLQSSIAQNDASQSTQQDAITAKAPTTITNLNDSFRTRVKAKPIY